jgi:hypothetical protein
MADDNGEVEQVAVEPLNEPDNSMPTWVWWLFGGAGLLIILLVIFAVATSTDEEQQPAPQPSYAESPSPSPSPSVSPSPSPSPSVTPSAEPSDSPTPMPSPTDVPSPEPTASDEPTPMPSPTDIPTPPSTFGEGKIVVGTDAAAGTYRVTLPVASGCVWALKSPSTAHGLTSDVVLGGIPTVTLADGDIFISKKCGTWSAVDPANLFKNVNAAVSAAPGVWLAGEDIKAGTWSTANLGETNDPSQLCKWTVTESLGTNFSTTVTRDLIFSGTGKVVLTAGQQFESTNCGTWTLLSK